MFFEITYKNLISGKNETYGKAYVSPVTMMVSSGQTEPVEG
jgi:hypothetical protein